MFFFAPSPCCVLKTVLETRKYFINKHVMRPEGWNCHLGSPPSWCQMSRATAGSPTSTCVPLLCTLVLWFRVILRNICSWCWIVYFLISFSMSIVCLISKYTVFVFLVLTLFVFLVFTVFVFQNTKDVLYLAKHHLSMIWTRQ